MDFLTSNCVGGSATAPTWLLTRESRSAMPHRWVSGSSDFPGSPRMISGSCGMPEFYGPLLRTSRKLTGAFPVTRMGYLRSREPPLTGPSVRTFVAVRLTTPWDPRSGCSTVLAGQRAQTAFSSAVTAREDLIREALSGS